VKNCKTCEHFPWREGFNLELLPQARCHIALVPRNWTQQQASENTDCRYFKAKAGLDIPEEAEAPAELLEGVPDETGTGETTAQPDIPEEAEAPKQPRQYNRK
jgi:hypothetical protein